MGSGRRTKKMVWLEGETDEFMGDTVTLDFNDEVNPDVVWDLRVHPLPFEDNEFDEIHAYHILEHLAQQGDYEFFFNEFNEYYRILKPEGRFYGVVPAVFGIWAWGDPGHARLFPKEYFIFLNRDSYKECGNGNPLTDYRFIYNGDFKLAYLNDDDLKSMAFILIKKEIEDGSITLNSSD